MSEKFEDDEDNDATTLIDFEQQVTFIRVIDDSFVASQLTIKAEVVSADDSNEQDYEVAFVKLKFWFENILPRCIAFSKSDENVINMLVNKDGENNTNNLLLLTPESPTDEHMAILLQAKMTALASGKLFFGAIEVKSNNVSGLRFTYIGNSAEVLPPMEDWVGLPNYFDQPWWHRDDASTLDVVPPDNIDLSVKPAWAFNLDFITNAIRPPAKDVVFRPEFKPTVIDGGRQDK